MQTLVLGRCAQIITLILSPHNITQTSFQYTRRLPQQSPMQQLRIVSFCTQNVRGTESWHIQLYVLSKNVIHFPQNLIWIKYHFLFPIQRFWHRCILIDMTDILDTANCTVIENSYLKGPTRHFLPLFLPHADRNRSILRKCMDISTGENQQLPKHQSHLSFTILSHFFVYP